MLKHFWVLLFLIVLRALSFHPFQVLCWRTLSQIFHSAAFSYMRQPCNPSLTARQWLYGMQHLDGAHVQALLSNNSNKVYSNVIAVLWVLTKRVRQCYFVQSSLTSPVLIEMFSFVLYLLRAHVQTLCLACKKKKSSKY